MTRRNEYRDTREYFVSLGSLVRGFSLRDGIEDGVGYGLDPETDWPSEADDLLVLGLLWESAALVADGVLDEYREALKALEHGEDIDWDESLYLEELPPRFRNRYDIPFIQNYLFAVADVASKLAHGWSPPSSVAQELALNSIVNHIQVIIDIREMEPYANWEEDLRSNLFEDLDFEFLYRDEYDGFENDTDFGPGGMISYKFDDWFRSQRGHPLSPVFTESPEYPD